MELLIGRIEAPSPSDSDSIVFKHESSMIDEMRQFIPNTLKAHRMAEIEAKLIPHAQPLIEAIGHRMAYEAAVNAKLDSRLIDLYLASVMKYDSAWYSENLGITRAQQADLEGKSAAALYPELESWLERLDVEAYVTAPIVSDEKWDAFVDSLETIGHHQTEDRRVKRPSSEPVFAQSRL
jgi:acyl-CoA oxidase